MRTATCIAAITLLGVTTLPAQEHDPDQGVAGGGTLPAGWAIRTDKGTNQDQVKFVAMGQGYHVTLGPRTIFYREADPRRRHRATRRPTASSSVAHTSSRMTSDTATS